MNSPSDSKTTSRATIADVAERAGVSTATVSRVINQTGPVAEETAAQVWAAVSELKYQPNAAAKGLASRKTNTLGLLVREISTPFFTPLFRGIEAGTSEAGYSLLIHAIQKAASPAITPIHRPLGEHNTDGLLVFASSMAEADLVDLHKRDFPLVLLHQAPPDGLNIPYVTFENKSGARKLVDHLIEVHNYRRIAFLQGPEDQEDSYWRELGYREALEAHGIPFDPALVAVGGFEEKMAEISVGKWLAAGTRIDAIFAGDDESAVGTIIALQQAGKRVPEDIAVVGFDDVHFYRYMLPPLTTVRAPVEQAGREAARQLIQLIRTGQADPLTLLPTELVVRHSCGCSN